MTRRDLLLLTGLLALLLSLAAWRLRGPAPLPAGGPPDRFSAGRAVALLEDLLRERVPHPVGTPANRVVRERIESRFRALGYTTEIQRQFVCNASPACATVENILATRPGDQGPWVLLVAHYDSVGAGPGASDDGAGVAALLEVARALGRPNGVAFLITDGEEAGLLGAEAFVASGWKDRVAVVVNVEYRGTSGPSFLFETSRGNAGLMPAVRAMRRPAASSLFYTIYELLPNDTDVSVFKRAGLQAMNFAAIGDVAWYHTPLDDLAHVNARTVQHHGDNLLAATRALLPGFERTNGNAVFFDVLNLGVVSWPAGWTPWIVLGSLAILVAGSRRESWRAALTGATLAILSIIGAAILAFALIWTAHLRAGEAGRLAYPQAVILAMWMSGIASSLFAYSLSTRHDRRGLFAGAGVAWHALAMAMAWTLPGVSFLFLVPAAAFSIALIVSAKPLYWAFLAPAAAGLILFPLTMFLYPALGKTSLLPIAAIVALMGTTIAPLLERPAYRLAGAVFALAVVTALVTNVFPVFTKESPRRQAIEYELPSPTVVAVAERTGEIVTIQVSSLRGADRLILAFDKRVDVLRVNGVAPAPPNPGRTWRGGVAIYDSRAVVEVRAAGPLEVTASDLTYGLPPDGAEKARTRDAAGAVTSNRGDVTISRFKLAVQ